MALYNNPQNDTAGERHLLIEMDTRYPSSNYAHIQAYVVRTAMPHITDIMQPSTVVAWRDDYQGKCAGYRNCSWSHTTGKIRGRNPVFTESLFLRGQIDAVNSQAYGVRVEFRDVTVSDATHADAMRSTLTRWAKFEQDMYGRQEQFQTKLHYLAKFLGVDSFLFVRTGYNGTWISRNEAFYVEDLAHAKVRCTQMIEDAHNKLIA